jgi:hypothetical protein
MAVSSSSLRLNREYCHGRAAIVASLAFGHVGEIDVKRQAAMKCRLTTYNWSDPIKVSDAQRGATKAPSFRRLRLNGAPKVTSLIPNAAQKVNLPRLLAIRRAVGMAPLDLFMRWRDGPHRVSCDRSDAFKLGHGIAGLCRRGERTHGEECQQIGGENTLHRVERYPALPPLTNHG